MTLAEKTVFCKGLWSVSIWLDRGRFVELEVCSIQATHSRKWNRIWTCVQYRCSGNDLEISWKTLRFILLVICYVHPETLGKWFNLLVETTNLGQGNYQKEKYLILQAVWFNMTVCEVFFHRAGSWISQLLFQDYFGHVALVLNWKGSRERDLTGHPGDDIIWWLEYNPKNFTWSPTKLMVRMIL